ncbi:MAG TPA: hypothetical protein VJP77_01590 [Planctomycetota bacterium]|nr:hypothetical protein [Planctomycetota bacterium]
MTEYGIDVCGGSGLWSLVAQFIEGAWGIVAPGGFNQEAKVILNQANEVLALGQALYASGELCIASWELTAPLLEPASVVLAEPANTLSGYAGPGARLVCAGAVGSLVFDVASDPLSPVQLGGLLPRQGRGFATRTTLALPPAQHQSGQVAHWLVEVNYGDDGTTDLSFMTPSGGLHVYSVSDSTPPVIQEVASWMHRGPFQWLDCAEQVQSQVELPNADLRDIGFLNDIWYVSTNPRAASMRNEQDVYPADTEFTLLVLKVLVPPEVPGVQIQLVKKQVICMPAGTPAIDAQDRAFRVTVDSARQLVYVALGIHGVAVFDISSDPLAPSPLGVRLPPALPAGEEEMMVECYHCLPGPGDKLYVSSLARGVWVIDNVWDIENSDSKFYRTRTQAMGMADVPADATGNEVFIADASAGVLRFTLVPPP